ncbi:nitrilase-related carbon-nitrogen hydrolase [Spirosoma panaciterrae]|uniref:nitrilase-related carbon-nitrogen hydrolase n=1 Tax=Spirosoma panaciterrae TaxID=496058 RepID=UPI0003821B47|nr:nitrilase-related carbon-nitrogen hydrolase [Spirosoma panaciterrae]
MQRLINLRSIGLSGSLLSAALLLAGAVCTLLLSPKWLVPAAAWFAPVFFLYYVQHTTTRYKWLWLILALVPANVLANLDVMPFPWFIMLAVILLDAGKTALLYALHRWLVRGQTAFIWTLAFPALWTVREFLEAQGDIGTFASVVNTQYAFPWLVQLVSVTGLWGITFLLYWFASVTVWAVQARQTGRPFRLGMSLYAAVFVLVLIYGAARYYTNQVFQAPQLTVGGVTVPNLPVLEALYQDATGKTIHIDPKSAPGSAPLQEANRGLIAFVRQAGHFPRGQAALQQVQDSLFHLSQRAVDKGAQLVLWSEGNLLLLKADEPALLAQGSAFAARNRVYLLMPIGVLHPGPIMAADGHSVRPFLENKTVLLDPAGRIANVFHKNHPVPIAEPSRPGNGQIPALATPYGTLAPSICYDADHATTMQQLGQKRVGLLLLPSGDWHAIAPYHSYMAVFRAVENGCSLVRQVSGGLSIFTDYRGKILASHNAYSPGDNLTVARVPVQSVPTLYSRFGDWLAYAAMALLAVFILRVGLNRLPNRLGLTRIT